MADEKIPTSNSDSVYIQLRNISLSGESIPVEQFILNRDVATFGFRQGEFYLLTAVEGHVTGAVFIGEGEFQMKPFLEVEQRHLSTLTGSPSISEHFNKMVLRFTDDTLEEIKKERTPRKVAPNPEAQSLLNDNKKALRKGRSYSFPNVAMAFLRYNLDARILTDLTWKGHSGLFMAYFEGKQYGDLLFGIDPLGAPYVAPEEVVLASLADGSLGIWTASHLKNHYQTDSFVDETHQLVDLEHHKIEASMKGKHLDASVETRFKGLETGPRVIAFDLFPRLRVREVTDDKGRNLNFIQEDKQQDANFAVILAEQLKRDEEYTLRFVYGGDEAVEDSGGGNYTLAARDNWYPNSFFGDRATYEMTFKTAKDLMLVATGQPVGDSREGNLQVSHWKSDFPLAVAGFNYGNFKKSSVQDEKLHYTIETFANKELPDFLGQITHANDLPDWTNQPNVESNTLSSLNTVSMIEKARNEAQAAMQIYTNTFGPLPYGRIAMTQQPFTDFGQAWPMLVYMPLTAYLDETFRHQLHLDDPKNFFKFVAAHEVAHQWWGHIVGWKSYRDQWMSEGFAEFSAPIFAQAVYGNQMFLKFWKDQRQLIMEKNKFGKRAADVGGVYLGYRLNTAKTGNVSRAMIYPKGAFMLHMLRMLMWDPQSKDSRFSEMMRDFIKTHFNSNVSTQDFMHTVERHMTKEMDVEGNGKMNWFLRQWVYGTVIPNYKLDYRLEDADKGRVKLIGKITQSGVDDEFKMLVPVYLDFDGKLLKLGSILASGNSTTPEFNVLLPQKPKRVVLCAYDDVLCNTSDR